MVCILPQVDIKKEVVKSQYGMSNPPEMATTVNVQFLVSHKLNDVLNSYFDVAREKEREWIVNPDMSFLR